MMRVALFLAFLIFGSTGGEIAITRGMKATGEPERLRPRELLQFLGRALRNGWFWAGVPLMALSFYALLVLLSGELGALDGRSAGLRRSGAGCLGIGDVSCRGAVRRDNPLGE